MSDDEHEALARRNVGTYGCHVLRVTGDQTGPQFCYSIGIEHSAGQPDLLVTGLDLDLGHSIINNYYARLKAGECFVPGVLYDDFIANFPVLFSPLLKQHYPEHVGWGRWFYGGDDFRVLQMIFPDTSGRWPWDDDASDAFRWHMPMLSERPKLRDPSA